MTAELAAERDAAGLLRRMRLGLDGLVHGYASVLFASGRLAGLLCLAATFWYPNTGLSGLLAAASAVAVAQLLRFPEPDSGLHVYNSLLVGLSLGAVYKLDLHLAVVIVLASAMAVVLTVVARAQLWRAERLPALSLPFVITAITAALAAQSWGTLSRYLAPSEILPAFFIPEIDAFFVAMGATFFSPHPASGLLLFLALLITSPWLAALGVLGFGVGHVLFAFLTATPDAYLVRWAGFNFILSAIAVGGIFLAPGLGATLLAALAAAMAALLAAAAQTFLVSFGLPVMAIPFLLTTFTLLAALRYRHPMARPWLLLERPDLPERSRERVELGRARNGDPDSTPLAPPFHGRWQIYQGFDGRHTHRGPWRYALDFYIEQEGRSFRDEGKRLEDYHCFGLPVLAPAEGWVAACRDDLPDQSPGEMDTANNWGNHVLLRLASGRYVLLAHLRQGSLRVTVGQWVRVGERLAACGSSGRSPQPHLHLQVQEGPRLGQATAPFHLAGVLTGGTGALAYQTAARPQRGEAVQAAAREPALAELLHLQVGTRFGYALFPQRGPEQEGVLQVDAGLDGVFRLLGRHGAAAAFESWPGVLAFYDRNGGPDPLLDLWLLCLGLTPLAGGELAWRDRPPARLLPLSLGQRLLLRLRHPLGALLESRYWRVWDAGSQCWRQHGEHRLALAPGLHVAAATEAELTPGQGCTRLSLRLDGKVWRAELRERGLAQDDGIPGWSQLLPATEE